MSPGSVADWLCELGGSGCLPSHIFSFLENIIVNTKSTWPGCCEVFANLRKFQMYNQTVLLSSILPSHIMWWVGSHMSVYTPCSATNITILHEMGCNLQKKNQTFLIVVL